MTETQEAIARQFTGAYGPFVPGDYQIGTYAHSVEGSGEIIWSFRKDGVGPLTYVLDTDEGWPVEVAASNIIKIGA